MLHLLQHRLVLLDMLEGIERSDSIEFGGKRDVPCIHLHELRPRDSAGRKSEALYSPLRTHKIDGREGVADFP